MADSEKVMPGMPPKPLGPRCRETPPLTQKKVQTTQGQTDCLQHLFPQFELFFLTCLLLFDNLDLRSQDKIKSLVIRNTYDPLVFFFGKSKLMISFD